MVGVGASCVVVGAGGVPRSLSIAALGSIVRTCAAAGAAPIEIVAAASHAIQNRPRIVMSSPGHRIGGEVNHCNDERARNKIGRARCRERGWQSVWIEAGDVT